MNLQELEEKSGHPARLIRFLISQEVVPRPSGGKRFASYGEEHIRALAIYEAAKSEGIESLDIIRAKVETGGMPTVFHIADGIELKVDKGSVPDVEAFVEMVRKLAKEGK